MPSILTYNKSTYYHLIRFKDKKVLQQHNNLSPLLVFIGHLLAFYLHSQTS